MTDNKLLAAWESGINELYRQRQDRSRLRWERVQQLFLARMRQAGRTFAEPYRARFFGILRKYEESVSQQTKQTERN